MWSKEYGSIPYVYQDDLWSVNLRLGAPPPKLLLGWAVLSPQRWVNYLYELTAEEQRTLGPLLVRCEAAIREVMGVERVYVCLFAESPEFPLHFHLIPRQLNLPKEYIGPAVFNIQAPEFELSDPDEVEEVRVRLEAALMAT